MERVCVWVWVTERERERESERERKSVWERGRALLDAAAVEAVGARQRPHRVPLLREHTAVHTRFWIIKFLSAY